MEKYDGALLSPESQSIHQEKQKELEYHNTISKQDSHNLWFQSDIAQHYKLVYNLSKKLNVNPTYDIVDLGLQINEDVVIVHNGRIEALFVCFPSSWNPGDKQGKTLEQLHKPVADGDVLRKMSNKLTQLMAGKYCYERWAWTVSPTSSRSMHPVYTFDKPNDVNDLWWRVERQITCPLEQGVSSAFLISVYVLKFDILTKWDQLLIRDSINTMSDSVLEYKNLKHIKTLINNALTVGDVYVNATKSTE